MTDTATWLKDIRDELQKEKKLPPADSLEKAMYLCDIAEHISLATHHLNYAIAKMIAYNGFEEKQK